MFRLSVTLLIVLALGLAGCQGSPFAAPGTQTAGGPGPMLEDPPTDTETGTVGQSEATNNFAPAASAEAGALPMSPDQRFPDIPLPASAREEMQRTYVYQSPDIELGRMVYTSRDSVNALARFYIDNLPATDWELDQVVQADGVKLTFYKPGKKLDVAVRPLGVGRPQELVLHLVPSTQGGATQ